MSAQSRTTVKGGRKPGLALCISLAMVEEIRDKRGSREWSPGQIAGLRWPNGAARSRLKDKLVKQFRSPRRRLGDQADATDILNKFRDGEHLLRGRLGIRLEQAVLALCRDRGKGPAWVEPNELCHYDALPLGDFERLVKDLEHGKPVTGEDIDLKTLHDLAGPGLARAWREMFGQRRPAPRRARKRRREERRDRGSPPAVGAVETTAVAAGGQNAPPASRQPTAEASSSGSGARPANHAWGTTPHAAVSVTEVRPGKAKSPPKRMGGLRRRGRLLRLGLGASLCLFFLTAAAYVKLDPDLRAYRILISQGSADALRLLENQVKGQGDYGYYLLAFAEYKNGRFLSARKKVWELLASAELNPFIESDCYYLLAAIHRGGGEVAAAEGYLHQSLKAIQPPLPEDPHRVYLISLAFAKTHLHAGDVASAAVWFAKSETLRSHAPDLADHYTVAARLEFDRGRYEQALQLVEASGQYIQTPDQRFNYHAELSSIYWKTGQLENASIHADLAVESASNQWMEAYANVLLIGVRACYGQNYSVLEDQVQEWLDNHPDPRLRQRLTLATRCESFSGY